MRREREERGKIGESGKEETGGEREGGDGG